MGVTLCPVTQKETSYTAKMGDHIMLDLEEWALVLSKMLRFHFNISEEIKTIVQTIRVEMKPELIPVAEEKSNYGKVVKKAIREMWSLEYEVDDLQHKFADSIGDMMLKAKPLQSVLNCIRNRQIAKMEEIKGIYADKIKDLEPMKVSRPAKPEPKPVDAPVAAAPAAPAPVAAKA